MLTGEVPFDADNEGAMLLQILQGSPRSLGSLRPNVDPMLEQLCLKAMAKNPEERFASCKAFAEALRSWDTPMVGIPEAAPLAGVAPGLLRPPGPLSLPPKNWRRGPQVEPKPAHDSAITPVPGPNESVLSNNWKRYWRLTCILTLGVLVGTAGVGGVTILLSDNNSSLLGSDQVATAQRDETKPKADKKNVEPQAPAEENGMGENANERVKKNDALPALAATRELDLGGGVTLKLKLIEAGTFLMGSPVGEEGRLESEFQHEVEITNPYYIGVYTVTRGQFRAFVDSSGYKTEAEKDGEGGYGYNLTSKQIEGRLTKYSFQRFTGFDQNDLHPVVNVTWNDAKAFCNWLGDKSSQCVALPTEAAMGIRSVASWHAEQVFHRQCRCERPRRLRQCRRSNRQGHLYSA